MTSKQKRLIVLGQPHKVTPGHTGTFRSLPNLHRVPRVNRDSGNRATKDHRVVSPKHPVTYLVGEPDV